MPADEDLPAAPTEPACLQSWHLANALTAACVAAHALALEAKVERLERDRRLLVRLLESGMAGLGGRYWLVEFWRVKKLAKRLGF